MPSNSFERVYRHPREKVWEAIFDPAAAEHWLGTVGSVMPEREGAAFCWLYDPGSRRPDVYGGRIEVLERHRRLELSVSMLTCDTTVRMVFTLTDDGVGGTRLALVQDGFPAEGGGRFEADGFNHHWDHFLDLLGEYLDGDPGNFHTMHGTELGVIPVGAIPGEGMLVHDVAVGAPAEGVGVRAGDVIRGAEDCLFDSLDDLDVWVETHRPGDEVRLLIGDRVVPVTLRAKRYSPA